MNEKDDGYSFHRMLLVVVYHAVAACNTQTVERTLNELAERFQLHKNDVVGRSHTWLDIPNAHNPGVWELPVMNMGLKAHTLVVGLGRVFHSSTEVAVSPHHAREWQHQQEDQAPEHVVHSLHRNCYYSHHEDVVFGANQSHNHSVEEPPVGVPWDYKMEDTVDFEREMVHADAYNHIPSLAEMDKENHVVDPTMPMFHHVID